MGIIFKVRLLSPNKKKTEPTASELDKYCMNVYFQKQSHKKRLDQHRKPTLANLASLASFAGKAAATITTLVSPVHHPSDRPALPP